MQISSAPDESNVPTINVSESTNSLSELIEPCDDPVLAMSIQKAATSVPLAFTVHPSQATSDEGDAVCQVMLSV